MDSQFIPKNLSSFFWHFIKKRWKPLLGAQIFVLAWALDHTLWPGIIMMLVDLITHFTGDKAEVWSYLAKPLWLGAALWISIEISFRLGGLLLAKVVPSIEADIRLAMFNYVQRHSYNYFGNNFAGNISNKISDMTQSFTHILQLVMQLFIPVILAILISSTLFFLINPYFTLILVVWISVVVGISFLLSSKCAQYADLHATSRSALAGKMIDALTNISNVRIFSRYSYEYRYLKVFQDDEKKKHLQSLRYVEQLKFATGIVTFLGAGLVMNIYMIYCWQQGFITAGEVVFIFNTTWNMSMMTWVASLELPTLYRELGVCKQALSIIRDEHDIIDEPQAIPLKVKKGEIIFEDVSFHYLPNHNIFENKNITIHAGEKVGLVGFSGSGKSTFVHLILRYYDVEQGRILIDGQDISKVTQDSLREQIAFIPQDASLFHRTLLENLVYGRQEASKEEIEIALQKSNVDEFVKRMPEGYDTLVGERGVKLSGGQRQRISIGRAILKNAPILILDEATSALDYNTERHIQEGLKGLMKGRTCIVIAHRLSTLRDMDRLLIFHEGQIIEEGTHQELLEAKGHYANLWSLQTDGFLPEEL